MDLGVLIANWGLVAAASLASVVLIIVLYAVLRNTSRGRLRAAVRQLRAAEREKTRVTQRLAACEQRAQKLEQRAERVKPRSLTEARGALDDARALSRIVDDKWMVAANHVRQIIFEEYPPHRHARLRARYLPDDAPDGRPFSF